jgi:hypothetical protein
VPAWQLVAGRRNRQLNGFFAVTFADTARPRLPPADGCLDQTGFAAGVPPWLELR